MNENLTVTTTSPTTAETTPLSLTPLDADATLQTIESSEDMEAISIKQTDRVRLVFKPTIIRDPNKNSGAKGTSFIRKKVKLMNGKM